MHGASFNASLGASCQSDAGNGPMSSNHRALVLGMKVQNLQRRPVDAAALGGKDRHAHQMQA
ncbi:hypothetical protein, partial [Rhizobium paranaense]|uniref:hypothetical protein n=1 Tax=Rhizobium paranaense TaxID=1650438 RepID=UPI001AEEF63B